MANDGIGSNSVDREGPGSARAGLSMESTHRN
jgi:hypothetical protein